MGNLSHTVGGTDNLVSFKSAARVPIDSLKVHFSPIQEGEGDPSPENVRPIIGWNEVEAYKSGKNVAQVTGYSAINTINADVHSTLSNKYGTTISTNNYNLPDSSVIITQTQAPNETNPSSYNNGYFAVMVNNLIYGCNYDISFKITNITNNILNANLNSIRLISPAGCTRVPIIINDNILIFKNMKWERYSEDPTNFSYNRSNFEIRNCGISFTLSEFMVTPVGINDGVFEPYCGERLPITFPNVNKNIFELAELNYDNWTSEGYSNSYLNRMAPIINLENGTITITCLGSGDSILYRKTHYPPGTYTLSYNMEKSAGHTGNPAKRMVVICFKKDGTIITNEELSISGLSWNKYYKGFFNTPGTFTVPDTVDYFTICFGISGDTAGETATFSNIQLELGSAATEYEPYNPDNTVYGGYIDLATGALMQTWGSLDLGSISWMTQSNEGTEWFRAILPIEVWQNTWYPNVTSSLNNHPPHFFIDRFKIVAGSAIYYGTAGDNVVGMDWRASIRIKCDLYGQDAEAFQAAMNGVILYYEYLTPVQVAVISPINCKTLLGQNNIWSNTNDVTEISYAVNDVAQIRAAKKRIMAASPKLKTVSSDLVTFNTDVAAPLKECKIEFKPKQNLNGYDRPWVGGAGKNLFAVKDAIGVRSDAAYGLTVTINSDESITISGTPTWTNTNVAKSFRALSIESGIYYGDAPVSHDYTGLNLKWFVVSKSNNISSVNTAGGISSDGTLTVSMTNTDLNEINVVLRGLICENASNETEWSPYENICPIEGWNSFETYKTSKSIVPFLANPFSFSYQDYYNGSSGWSNIINSDELPTGAQLIYSAYLNCANAVVSGENCVKIWIMQSNGKYRYAEGNIIQTGNSGMSYISTNVRDTDVSFEFGLGIRKGTIASNPMVEINNAPSNFEPYNGTTIPITFPTEAGTIYGGYVDLVNGKLIIDFVVEEPNERIFSIEPTYACQWGHSKCATNGYINFRNGISSHWKNTIYDNRQFVYLNINGAFFIGKEFFDAAGIDFTNEAIQNYIAEQKAKGTPLQAGGPLATPLEYDIDPQTIKALRGTNNIWSTSNGPITIKYWKH